MRLRIKNGMQPPTNFATVVTDLTTCHNTWFHPGVDRCYVATEESRRQALGIGLVPDQLRMFGLPIRPAFGRNFASKKKLRKCEVGLGAVCARVSVGCLGDRLSGCLTERLPGGAIPSLAGFILRCSCSQCVSSLLFSWLPRLPASDPGCLPPPPPLWCVLVFRSLGMVADKPAILLVGGGEGMGPVEKTVDGVAKVGGGGRLCGFGCTTYLCVCVHGIGIVLVCLPEKVRAPAHRMTSPCRCSHLLQQIGAGCQLVVICGRNAKLVEKLQNK